MSDSRTPQLENGYIRIATEWLEALVRAEYPGSVKDFVLVIARETWGWNETWREIPAQRLAELLSVSVARVKQLREDACRWNLVEWEHGDGPGNSGKYRVQKDYLDWIERHKTGKWDARATGKAVVTGNDGLSGKDGVASSGKDGVASNRQGRANPHYKDNLTNTLQTGDRGGPLLPADTHLLTCNDPFTAEVQRYFCTSNPPVLSVPDAQAYAVKCKQLCGVGNADFTEADLLEAITNGANGPTPGGECDVRFGPQKWVDRLRREKQATARASPGPGTSPPEDDRSKFAPKEEDDAA